MQNTELHHFDKKLKFFILEILPTHMHTEQPCKMELCSPFFRV